MELPLAHFSERRLPALIAGNSVILKMAAQTPLVAERYAEAFKAAGLPDGVFQFLHLSHDQVAKTIADPRIAFVAFTGSVPGGHAIQQAAARRFIATGLELGGKDPAYVRADADLKFAVENLVDGSYFNSGQSCCGIERIYVQKPLFKDFVDGFVELDSAIQARQSAGERNQPRPDWCAPMPPMPCARRSSRRRARALRRCLN